MTEQTASSEKIHVRSKSKNLPQNMFHDTFLFLACVSQMIVARMRDYPFKRFYYLVKISHSFITVTKFYYAKKLLRKEWRITVYFSYFVTGGAEVSSASLTAFDDILNGPFKTYLDLSKRIGSEVATIGEMVEAAFKAHRAY